MKVIKIKYIDNSDRAREEFVCASMISEAVRIIEEYANEQGHGFKAIISAFRDKEVIQ